MKPSQVAKIDRDTPRFPVARVSLVDEPSLEFGGLQLALQQPDPQVDAFERILSQARQRGHDLRFEVTNPDRSVERFIMRREGTLLPLERATPARTRQQTPAAAVNAASPPAVPARASGSLLTDRQRRALLWGGSVFAVLLIASVVVLVLDPTSSTEPSTQAAPEPPTPAAATLYTEDPPPGWSDEAQWALPIAESTEPALDVKTGTGAVLTPDNRSTEQTAKETAGDVDEREANFLSVLDESGTTKFAVELESPPTKGPIITSIDDQAVVALLSGSTLSYWPLDGAAEDLTEIEIPTKAASSMIANEHGALVEISQNKLGILTADGFDEIAALPLTTPVAVTPNGLLSIEEDSGTWWLSTPSDDPEEVQPAAPAGASAFSAAVCADAEQVVLLWESEAASSASYKQPGYLAAYDTSSGELLASVEVDSMASNVSPSCPNNTVSGLTAGDGFILDVSGDPALTLVADLKTDTVADAAYGTVEGDPAQVSADGDVTPIADNALVPVAYRDDEAYVISQWQLYKLPPE